MSTCDQAGFGKADMLYCINRGIPSNYTIGTPATLPTDKACADLCAADPKCKAYTYNPSKKQCTKKSARQFVYQAGMQSGPVINPRVWWLPPCTGDAQTKGLYKCNASIASSANVDAPVFKNNWSACQAMCTSDTRCKGWTWNPSGMCQKKSDATMFYNLFYLSGARKSGGTNDSSGSDTTTGASSGTSAESTASTPTSAPAATPAPTSPPQTEWWRQLSPLGVEWWVVIAAGLVLLLMLGAVGMMAMMTMSG